MTGEQPQRGQLRMPRVPEEAPQWACDLMKDCLQETPSARPTAAQVLKRLSEGAEDVRASRRRPADPAPNGDLPKQRSIQVPPPAAVSPFANS